MNPLDIIEKYYEQQSLAYRVLMTHSEMVAKKAFQLAERVRHLHPDTGFIREAALLHDIGILFTEAPAIGCHGDKPYILHGQLGRELLEKEGLPDHALVCERHTGVGITVQDIERQGLPLSKRNMVPESLEEIIICFADKFYSKNPRKLLKERSLAAIKKKLAHFGEDKVEKIEEWAQLFGMAGLI